MKSKQIGRWIIVVKDSKRFGMVVNVCDQNNSVIISYTLRTFLSANGDELKLNASNVEMTMNSSELYQAQVFAYESQAVNMATHMNTFIVNSKGE
jgi:hypothetical protein